MSAHTQAKATEDDDHTCSGPYDLAVSLLTGSYIIIRRMDTDSRRRVVAFIDGLDDWDRFVAALKDGADEVAAVFAIDAVSR